MVEILKTMTFLFLFAIFQSVLGDTFFGKLMLKTPATGKRHSIFEKSPVVFATRRSTYLKKFGDVFKVHIPAIAEGAPQNTVSFESMRFSSYFLSKDKKDDNFKIREKNGTDLDFDNRATFIIERRAGIEGSGMLRISAAPSKYMCVRRGANVGDSALQAIEKESNDDFKFRCSFYIQKLRDENVDDAIKKSKLENNKASKNQNQNQDQLKTSAIDSLLQEFNKKIENHQKSLLTEAASKKHQIKEVFQRPTKKAMVAHRIPKLKKKLNVTLNTAAKLKKPQNSIAKNVKQHKSPKLVETKKNRLNRNNERYNQNVPVYNNMYNPYYNQYGQYVNSFNNPLSNFFKKEHIVSSPMNQVPVATLNSSYKQNNMPVAAVDAKNIQNVYAKAAAANAAGGSGNTAHSTPKFKSSSKEIGPKKPINLHNFQTKYNNQEPALNLHGLVHSVRLPVTRSQISNSTGEHLKQTQNSTASNAKNESAANAKNESAANENIFFRSNDLKEARIEQDSATEHNSTLAVPKILENQDEKSNISLNTKNETSSLIKNDTKIESSTTTTFTSPKPENTTTTNATKYISSNSSILNNTAPHLPDVNSATNLTKNNESLANNTSSFTDLTSRNATADETSPLLNNTAISSNNNITTLLENKNSNSTLVLQGNSSSNFTSNGTSNASARDTILTLDDSEDNQVTHKDAKIKRNSTNLVLPSSQKLKNETLKVESPHSAKNSTIKANLTSTDDVKFKKDTGNMNKTKLNLTVANANENTTVLNLSSKKNMNNSTVNITKTDLLDNSTVPTEQVSNATVFQKNATSPKASIEKANKSDETVAITQNGHAKMLNTTPVDNVLPDEAIENQINQAAKSDFEQNSNVNSNKVSLLHREYQENSLPYELQNQTEGFSPQLHKFANASISFGDLNENTGPIDEESELRNIALGGSKKTDSPEEQNAMVMQGIQGAFRKINSNDEHDVENKIKSLDMEDKTSPNILANEIRNNHNPRLQNLLMGGYKMMNQTMPMFNETGDENIENYGTRSETENGAEDETNGDTRSRLPDRHIPGGHRNLIDHYHDHDHDIKDNFHEHVNDLSKNDKERYNELNHFHSANENHHYFNNDEMHPPTHQDNNLINDLHHHYHGYVNDDTMSPPLHVEHYPFVDHNHEYVHHGVESVPVQEVEGDVVHHVDTGDASDHVHGHHHPVVGSPLNQPTTLYENDHYVPAKSNGEFDDHYMGHGHLSDETNVQHHTHHVVTVKSEAERQKMVHGLVDVGKDKCVSLQIVNDIGRRYRLISSINKHGYTPRGKVFTLKTVFKDPNAHKLVLFKAIDELEPTNDLLINGKTKYLAFPTSCDSDSKMVHITRVHQHPSIVGCGTSKSSDCETKKTNIAGFNHQSRPQLKLTNNYKRSYLELPQTSGCVRAYHSKNPYSSSCCVFPFVFGGVQHKECIRSGEKSWCGTTENVDRDKKWGLCTPPTYPDDSSNNNIVNQPSQNKCDLHCKVRCLPSCEFSCC